MLEQDLGIITTTFHSSIFYNIYLHKFFKTRGCIFIFSYATLLVY